MIYIYNKTTFDIVLALQMESSTGPKLSQNVEVSYSYIFSIIKELEEYGFIYRDNNYRPMKIVLTEKGKELAKKMKELLEMTKI